MRQHRSTMEMLPFGSLKINPRAQRRLIPSFVRQLMSAWSLEEAGVVTVSIRDRIPYVVDGQHRVRAAIGLGLHETKIRCHVYRDLTPQEEAAKFLTLNNTKNVSAFDRYRIGLEAKDPLCVEVRDTLRRHGLEVSYEASDGKVACVQMMLTLAARGTLDEVCQLLVGAWGTRATAFERAIVGGAGVVVGYYDGDLDLDAMAGKLSGYRGGAAALRGDARGLSDYKPISITKAAAELMVDTYNKGRRKGKLPPLS